jgi:DNA polymerase II small subunit
MVEILRRRHLSPIYGGNKVLPTRRDYLIIDEVPDILHMGHIHKNGATDYHGTLVINSGTWQSRTSYQIKQGHIPSPAILPVYELKSMNLSYVDFNTLGE